MIRMMIATIRQIIIRNFFCEQKRKQKKWICVVNGHNIHQMEENSRAHSSNTDDAKNTHKVDRDSRNSDGGTVILELDLIKKIKGGL